MTENVIGKNNKDYNYIGCRWIFQDICNQIEDCVEIIVYFLKNLSYYI